MTLEHYPGMTEAELGRIEAEAAARFQLRDCIIIHRVGELRPGDNIVLVVTASPHRQAAFDAAAFLMDYLKTRAPFWKKETAASGESVWVDAREADEDAAAGGGDGGIHQRSCCMPALQWDCLPNASTIKDGVGVNSRPLQR